MTAINAAALARWRSRLPAANVLALIQELPRSNVHPEGRPLPFASTWQTGQAQWPLSGYPNYTPLPRDDQGLHDLQYQVELLEAGHYWLPAIGAPQPAQTRAQSSDPWVGSAWHNYEGYIEPLDQLAAWGAPIAFVLTQPESVLYLDSFPGSGAPLDWKGTPIPDVPLVYDRHEIPVSGDNPVALTTAFRIRGLLIEGTADEDTASEHVLAEFVGSGNPVEVVQVVGGGVKVRYTYGSGSSAEEDLTLGEWWYSGHEPSTSVSQIHIKADALGGRTYAGDVTSISGLRVLQTVDPDGPTEPWTDAGELWTAEPANSWADMQSRHPSPASVLIVSNNEGSKLSAYEQYAEASERFLAAHGDELSPEERAEAIMGGYNTRYSLLLDGMRDSLSATWAARSKIIAYNSTLVFTHARYGGWRLDNYYWSGGLGYEKNYWDGSSPEYYLNPWEETKFDSTIYSPQTEFMNVRWQLDQVYDTNSEFFYEMSVWDGHQPANAGNAALDKRAAFAATGYPFTPARYKAWLRFGMWLTFPRVVREFRNTGEGVGTTGEEYFEAFLAAVDEIHASPALTRFWRLGTVVAHPSRVHPYRTSPAAEQPSSATWYALETSLTETPSEPTTPPLTTEVPVWAMALVIGSDPTREWMVYAYSPKGDRSDVTIEVPGYGNLVADVPAAGAFFFISE